MNITVNIQAPELAGAILSLAQALGSAPNKLGEQVTATLETQATPMQQQQGVPIQQTQQAPTQQQPIQQAPPVQQEHPQQPTAVPTTNPTYTMDQLAVAATQLMDAGRRDDLLALLGQFNVQALTALPKEQYGAFATRLRELGAKI